VLKVLQEFPEAVFLGIALKSLLDAQTSCHAKPPTRLEYWLNKYLTFDSTTGSCSNFYRSFQRLFSLASQWNHYSMPTASGRALPPTRPEFQLNRSLTLDPFVGSCLQFYRSFWRLFSMASQRNRYSTPTMSGWDKPPTRPECRLNRSITLDPAIGSCSNIYRSFRRLISLVWQWNPYLTHLVSSWATPPTRPKYMLNRSLILDLNVGLLSNVYKSLRRLFSLSSKRYHYSTLMTSSRAWPLSRLEYRVNRFVTVDLTVGSCSTFYGSFRRLFSLALQ